MHDKEFSHYNVVGENVWGKAVQTFQCDTEEDAIQTAVRLLDCDDYDNVYKVRIEKVYNLVNWW